MTTYRAQAVLMMDDGLFENAATNTWYFDSDDFTTLAPARDALLQFYIDIDGFMASNIDPSTSVIKWYEINGVLPTGPPIIEQPMTGFTPGPTSGPPEVALVMSFRSSVIPGSPPARHRGRVYLGPLGNIGADRPTTADVNGIAAAGQTLLDAVDPAPGGWLWMQHSPTAASYSQVVNGYVDNEWDTQRRRGRKATLRTTFQN